MGIGTFICSAGMKENPVFSSLSVLFSREVLLESSCRVFFGQGQPPGLQYRHHQLCPLYSMGLFTSTPIDVKNPKLLLDLGNFNFNQHKLMMIVYSHLVLIGLGYIASLFFSKPTLAPDLLYSKRKQN
jgi:hypothetical protein